MIFRLPLLLLALTSGLPTPAQSRLDLPGFDRPAPGRLILTDGTELTGAIECSESRVQIRVGNRLRRLDWSKVTEVSFDSPEATASVRPTEEVLAIYERRVAEIARQKDAGGKLPASEVVSLGRWCLAREMYDEARAVLSPLLDKDPYHAAALAAFRRVTDLHVPRIQVRLPLEGRWMPSVDTTRHHRKKVFAVYAIDFVKPDRSGAVHSARGGNLEDHFAWDQPVLAPADGTVFWAEGEYPDMPVGRAGGFDQANGVAIQHADGEVSLLTHLRKDSLTVSVGDRVECGQVVGRVGNSGASGLPHLHFTVYRYMFGCGASVPWRIGAYRRRFQTRSGWHTVIFRNAPCPEGSAIEHFPGN